MISFFPEPQHNANVNLQWYLFQHDCAVVEYAFISHACHTAQLLKDFWGIMLGILLELEQTINLTCLRVDIDVEVARCGRKTRNGLNVGSQSVSIVISKEPGASLVACYSQISCTNC